MSKKSFNRMLLLVVATAALFSTNAYPDSEMTLNMKFDLRNNKSQFAARMVSGGTRAYIATTLHSAEILPGLPENIKLGKSSKIEILSPQLPTGCVPVLAPGQSPFGFINGMDGAAGNVFNFLLDGKSCEQFLTDLQNTQLSVRLINVPAKQNGVDTILPSVIITVLDLPQ